MTQERQLPVLDAAVEPEGGRRVAGGDDGRVPAVTTEQPCPCGRPRNTDAEMRRWQNEVRRAVFGSSSLDWALAICWSYPGQQCDTTTRPAQKDG